MYLSRRKFIKLNAALPATLLSVGNVFVSPVNIDLDKLFDENLNADPTLSAQWGYRKPNGIAWDRWTFAGEEWHRATIERMDRQLHQIAANAKSGDLDSELFAYVCNDQKLRSHWHHNDYVFHSGTAPHFRAFSALIAYQPILSVPDAEAYVEKVRDTARICRLEFELLRKRHLRDVQLPGFNFVDLARSASDAANTALVADTKQHPIIGDFKIKCSNASIHSAAIAKYEIEIEQFLIQEFAPLIQNQATYYAGWASEKYPDRGAWSLPNGADYYDAQIRLHTTQDERPADIHRYGLDEVSRLQAELSATGPKLGLTSDFKAVQYALRHEDRFLFSDDADGRAEALELALKIVENASALKERMIDRTMGATLQVLATDELSAPNAGRAYYSEPGADGAPGKFYLNVWNIRQNPRYQLPAVVHHEAIPGHHLQAAILHNRTLLRFRKHLYINSFAEGWALYAEKFAGELGLYPDAASEAGRIALELFRAVRLVVDTGIHHHRWTFDRAFRYMDDNSVNSRDDTLAEIKRYFNWPAQALGYKIGMRQFEAQRTRAMSQLGSRFALNKFHGHALEQGALPSALFEKSITRYINESVK